MKYRILQVNDTFFPQYRDWFLWNYFHENFAGYYVCVSYGDLESARLFLANYKPTKPKDPDVTIHTYP